MKREKREEIVRKGVVEHERLEQQFEKKEKELRRQYEELQKRFEEERMKVFNVNSCFFLFSSSHFSKTYFRFQEYMSISRESERSTSVVSDDVFDAAVPLGPACRPHS
jgi:hypothetical protein